MKVSVVIPTYSMDRYDDFTECVEATLAQTYDPIDLVLIVDGNRAVYDRATDDFGHHENTTVYYNSDEAGPISRANMGFVQASGDLVVLTDDDAVPNTDWIEQLVDAYKRHDAIAVGGRVEPEWVHEKADFLPEEFYFLIGATHRGFPTEEKEVRNTFGANLGIDREVYLQLGGVKQGGIDPSSVQGRETEFCARMKREFDRGVVYTPDAVVSHKIYDYRCDERWLLERAFWQGYSKRAMETLVPESSTEESEFLRRLLGRYVPERIKSLLKAPSRIKGHQLLWIFLLLGAVGIGYLYGLIRWRN